MLLALPALKEQKVTMDQRARKVLKVIQVLSALPAQQVLKVMVALKVV